MIPKIPLWIKATVILFLVTTLVTFSLNWYNKQIEIAREGAADSVRNEWNEKLVKSEKRFRQIENDLRKQKEKSDETSKKQISDLSNRVRTLTASLSDFASKPKDSTSGANRAVAEVGRTPEGETRILYREAIGNLIAEAQRADEVSIALQGCYRDYNTARDKLEAK